MFLCIFLSLCNGMFVYSRCTVIVNFRIHDCVIDFRILIGQKFTNSVPHGGKITEAATPIPRPYPTRTLGGMHQRVRNNIFTRAILQLLSKLGQ